MSDDENQDSLEALGDPLQRKVLIKGEDDRPAAGEEVSTAVADPKRVELVLRESEEKYRRLIETTGTGYVILDDRGRVTDANQEYVRLTGRPELEAVIGHSVLEWTAPHDLERNTAEVQKCLEQGMVRNLEIDYLTPTGLIIPVEINATVLRTSDSLRILTLCRDISERKRAEVSLRESEARYRALFEANPHPMWVYDLETLAFLAVNDAAVSHYGFSREEFLALTIADIRPPVDVPHLLENVDRVKEKRFDEADVWKHRTKDGSIIEVEITSHYMDYRGRSARLVLAYDITERKRSEVAVRESEARYRALFEANPQPMWVYDSGTLAFLAVNDAAVAHYGFSREEFQAMTIADIRPTEDLPRLLEILAQPGEQRVDRSGTWRHRKKDGSIIYVEISSHVLEYEGRRAKLVLVNDVTERLRAAEEKEKLQAQLLQAQKMESVARLAGGVAHDFNNMLSAILGHAELAMMQCHPSESIQADLQAIQNAAQRSAQLTRQLLAFARTQTVAPQGLDLNDTVAGLLKMLLRLIGEDIDLVWMPAPGLWPVKMDPSQIDQILVNLCINARDAITGVGKITIETENSAFDEDYCTLHPDFSCGEYVLLAVSDDGCGMDPEILDRLFEPFFTTTEVGKGTGLGLATVYGIVRQNDGFINVTSEAGQGTTFKIYLPRFAGAALESILAGPQEAPRGRGELVLLVEDEAAILNMGRAMLEGLGYQVLTAGTPGEALRQAEAHAAEIKLLITDVVMPEMNGRELAKLLGAVRPGLKCLFTSGYTAEIIAHRGVLDEGVCFLAKPFSINDLAVKARQILEGR
ncbi:MAG: PAS domain S-box protein [Deltaproteobacteria bacterium]|nr:PAS domain S-box protein [Deltaproteobacteria bacterium]